jgi:hypothetical protein
MKIENEVKRAYNKKLTFNSFRKIVGGAMIFVALMFASPPFDMIPNDFLNIFLAIFIVSFTGLDKLSVLFFTYTLFPLILFSLGIFIFPVNGNRIDFCVKWFRNILKGYIKFIKKPFNLVLSIIVFLIIYYFYSKILLSMI